MISRYSDDEVSSIFSYSTKLNLWQCVEIAHCRSLEEEYIIPHGVSRSLSTVQISESEHSIKELETKHDLAAFVFLLESKCNSPYARYVHFGLTSSDVVDTSLFLQLKIANSYIAKMSNELLLKLSNLIDSNRSTRFLSRTHTQAAQINTFGSFLSSFVYPIYEGYKKLCKVKYFGKLSGAIGKNSYWPCHVERNALNALNLHISPYPTQVINRQYVLDALRPVSDISSAIEHLAIQLRLLAHHQVGEINEGFADSQVGSSAMPQKRNPVSLENICGITRIIKSHIRCLEDNIISWHDRDISHSSVERVLIPDIYHLCSYAINRMISVISGLKVNKERMEENVNENRLLCSLESFMMNDIVNGSTREQAHRKYSDASDRIRQGNRLEALPYHGVNEDPFVVFVFPENEQPLRYTTLSDFNPKSFFQRTV